MNKQFEDDPILEQQVEKLHLISIYSRWILVLFCWLTLVPWGLWQLRDTLSLCRQYCTWAIWRVDMFEFHFGAGLAIIFTIAFTTSTLVWQSYHILNGGLSEKEKYYLAKKVKKINQQGRKNFLWHWLKNP